MPDCRITRVTLRLAFSLEGFKCESLDRRGGLGKVQRRLGTDLPKAVDALKRELAA